MFLLKLLAVWPFWMLYPLSRFLAFSLRIIGYRKEIITNNLKNSFPDKPEKWYQDIRNKFYLNFTDLIVETIKLSTISYAQLKKRVVVENPELLTTLYQNNKGAVIVHSHFCNWEWVSVGLGLYTKHNYIGVYKPLSNKKVDETMKRIRGKFGLELVPMKQAPRKIISQKKPTLSLLIADQTPFKTEIEYKTTFLNQLTPVFFRP